MPPPDFVAPANNFVAPNVPVPPPAAAPAPSAYANALQEAKAKALAKIMMGYQYRAVEGDNDDKKIWQFRAQHADARNLLGNSRVQDDNRLLPWQRQRGLRSDDPRSGYVLHDLTEKAFGHNFGRGDYDDTDARGDWLARKMPDAIKRIGSGAIAQALMEYGVEPGEGPQSMGQNYMKGVQQFLAENNKAMDPGFSSVGSERDAAQNPIGEQDNIGGVEFSGVPLGDVATTMVEGGYLGPQAGGGTIKGLGGFKGARGGKIGGAIDVAKFAGPIPLAYQIFKSWNDPTYNAMGPVGYAPDPSDLGVDAMGSDDTGPDGTSWGGYM